MTPLHQAALAYAAKGIPVFPIEAGGKRPLPGSHSYKDATTDPQIIADWWKNGDWNIATVPAASGWIVVDIDDKNGHRGSHSWAELCPETPDTLTIRTPSGGVHLYFTGTMRPSAGKLGDGIDIRSEDSYVLLPPSIVAGSTYEIVNSVPPAPWPLNETVVRRQEPASAPEGVVVDPEGIEAWVIELIEAAIEQDGDAVVGNALNQRTLELAMRLGDGPQYGYAVSEDTAVELMLTHWSAEDQVDVTIRNAYKSRQNPLGCGQAGSASRKYDPIFGVRPYGPEPIGDILESPQAVTSHASLISGDKFMMEPIRWVWPGWLAQGKFHVLGGQKGAGKSTLAFSLLAKITAGGTWPDGTKISGGADCLIWSGEDDIKDTILPRIAVSGGVLSRVHFPDRVFNGSGSRHFDPATDFPSLLHAARSLPALKVILIDPIVSVVSGDSHNNAETRRGLQPIVDFAEETGAAIIGITHFTKNTQGRDPIDRITGSLAFGAVPRVVWGASKGEEEAAPRRLVRISSNIGASGGGFEYLLQQHPVPGHKFTAQRIMWGDRINGSAFELIEGDKGQAKTKLLVGVNLLEKLLKEAGSAGMAQQEIKMFTDDQDISWGTIKSARATFGDKIVPFKVGMASWWRLAP